MPEFSHLGVEETKLYRMTANPKMKHKRTFFSSTVCRARTRAGTASQASNASGDSADSIVRDESAIWQVPGPPSTTRTWMVPSSTTPTCPHTAKTWTNRKVECDKQCVQWTTHGLCSHSIAVAERADSLSKFLAWYNNSKRRETRLTVLAGATCHLLVGKRAELRTQPKEEECPPTRGKW